MKEDTSAIEVVGDTPTNARGELGLRLFKKKLIKIRTTLHITEVICWLFKERMFKPSTFGSIISPLSSSALEVVV